MIAKKIIPSKYFFGEIQIPPSKSFTQRTLALSLISKKKTKISNIGFSDDENVVLNLLKLFKNVEFTNDNEIVVSGSLKKLTFSEINFGESGLATRMFTPILTNYNKILELHGDGSIMKRPMSFFDEILPNLGIDFKSNFGKLPFFISNSIKPKNITVDGSLSSQFISGLIYAFVACPTLKNEKIKILNLKSRPYLELTLQVLEKFGVNLKIKEDDVIEFNGPYELNEIEIDIESDWSSASYFLVAAALLGEISIKKLNVNSKQADIKVLEALTDFGAIVEIDNDLVKIKKNKHLSFYFDATDCPDLFPTLAVLGCFGNSISKIKGLHRLKHKESDRASSIQQEFKKFGVKIDLDYQIDTMIVHPVDKINSSIIDSHNDHRIAMATSILALFGDQTSYIQNPNCVSKSFPKFYELLETCTHT